MGRQLLNASLDLDTSALNRARRLLRGAPKRIAAHRLTVGIHETEGAQAKVDYEGKATQESLVEVAAAHEFGAGLLPDRSFIRTWFDMNIDRLKVELKAAMEAEYNGDREAVDRLGAEWAVSLQDWIAQEHGHLAALTEFTIDEKERAGLPFADTPLLATGQLVRALRARLDGGYVG